MTTRSRWILLALTLSISHLVLSLSSFAEAPDDPWALRLSLVHVDPDLAIDNRGSDGSRVQVEAEEDTGIALFAERRWSRRWGVELGVTTASPRVLVRVGDPAGNSFEVGGSASMTSFTAGLTYHFLPERRADLYLAGRFAFVQFGDLTLTSSGLGSQRQRSDDDAGWSLGLGLDIPLGESPWGLHFALSHLDVQLGLTNAEDGTRSFLELDPALAEVGLVYRF